MLIMSVPDFRFCALCITNRVIRIPVYIVNALYLWPITLWTYLLYGRPQKAAKGEGPPSCHNANKESSAPETAERDGADAQNDHGQPHCDNCHHQPGELENQATEPGQHEGPGAHDQHQDQHHEHQHGGERPIFATVTVAVCHCGAGCVLGDIIGEWLVYGTGAAINGESLWVNYLVGKYTCLLAPLIASILIPRQTLHLRLHLALSSNTTLSRQCLAITGLKPSSAP